MSITQFSTRQLGSSSVNRDDLDTTTTTKAVVAKLIAGSGISLGSSGVDPGTGDVTITATGGTPTISMSSVEVNLGTAKRSGHFTIAGSGLTVGKAVLIAQATGPYTGKGTRADEAEMDMLIVTGVVTDASTITCYWNSIHAVMGNFKFNYLINS